MDLTSNLKSSFPHGVYRHEGLEHSVGSIDLILREHALACLYWYPGRNPLAWDLMHRQELLQWYGLRETYQKYYRFWDQVLNYARLEGLAVPISEPDFIIPNASVRPPAFHYPDAILRFIREHYVPSQMAEWKSGPRDDLSVRTQGETLARITARTREAICLLGIMLEHAGAHSRFFNYRLFLERAIFSLLGLNPVLHLVMLEEYIDFTIRSAISLAEYFYHWSTDIRLAFQELPALFHDDLLEALGELANLLQQFIAHSGQGLSDGGETLIL